MNNQNEHQAYFDRMKAMTAMRNRHITPVEREYMRSHPLAELNAAQLQRHAHSIGADVRHLDHRLDILRAIDNHKTNGK